MRHAPFVIGESLIVRALLVGCLAVTTGGHAAAAAAPDITTIPATSAPAAPSYSADRLYNLANAYARAGKPGLAILNYQRAALLAPNDPDIEANLRFVRTTAKVPAEPASRFERSFTAINPTLLAWSGVFGLGLATAATLALGGARFTGRRRILVAVGFLLLAVTVGNGIALSPKLHAGVVLTPATPARVSPVPMGDSVFVLPEAETVTIAAEHEGFFLVRTREGRSGWVAAANIARVVPRR